MQERPEDMFMNTIVNYFDSTCRIIIDVKQHGQIHLKMISFGLMKKYFSLYKKQEVINWYLIGKQQMTSKLSFLVSAISISKSIWSSIAYLL